MKIFVSYYSEEVEHKKMFLTHAKNMVNNGGPVPFEFFSGDQIKAGEDWSATLEQELQNCDGGVLLLSANFVNSEWCRKEARELYEGMRKGQKKVVPVLVSDFNWEGVEWLKDYQFANPQPVKPIIGPTQNPDTAWKEVVNRIWEAFDLSASETLVPPLATRTSGVAPVKVGDLRAALRRGTGQLALILGPGIHEPRGPHPAAGHLRRQFEALREKLHDGSDGLIYLRDVIESNLPGVLEAPLPTIGPNAEPWRGDLRTFQEGLARLGALACRVFAQNMLDDKIAITDMRTVSIELRETEMTQELRQALFEVTRQVFTLHDRRELTEGSDDLGLGVRGMREQIVALTYMIFGADLCSSRDRECGEWLQNVRNTLGWTGWKPIQELVAADPSRSRRLALSQVEWLGDLLWHTLRFDAPAYPKPDDLAFQISVCTEEFTPPRRESVGTIASLAVPSGYQTEESMMTLKKLVGRIGQWLGLAFSNGQDKTSSVLARALCQGMSKAGAGSESRDASGDIASGLSIVVTTNFDNELEGSLHSMRKSHHVLFPVYHRRASGKRGTPDDSGLAWMLRSELWREKHPSEHVDWYLLDNQDLRQQNLRQVLKFRAPLIVKLYGSPLTIIDDEMVMVRGERNQDQSCHFAHRLIVSDIDFLGVMVQEWWPSDLKNILYGTEGRLLCFLGYGLGDVDTRLRLYDQVYRRDRLPRDPDRAAAVPVVVVSPPEDPVYKSVVGRMNANTLIEDLDRVIQEIEKACDA